MDCQGNLHDGNIIDASHTDLKPKIGLTFSSENEAYEFYDHYGSIVGFSIRKECVHKKMINDGEEEKEVILSRRFLCCKAGNRGPDKREWKIRRPRAETRTDCFAKMCVSRLPNGEYIVRVFYDNHNHDLHTPATRHFMQSQRSISDLQGYEIELAEASGLKQKTTFDYMGNQAGGSENLGYTKLDLKNYLRTKRQRALAYGVAGGLSAYFVDQAVLDPLFTYSFQYDIDEKVAY